MKTFKELPEFIQQKMLDYQVEQRNKRDEQVFIDDILAHKIGGGFYWDDTIEGSRFWNDLLISDKPIQEVLNEYNVHPPIETQTLDSSIIKLRERAERLGFEVEIVFNPIKKKKHD